MRSAGSASPPEPKGKVGSEEGHGACHRRSYDATRLHYDLRLELDGVMKSWAVTARPCQPGAVAKSVCCRRSKIIRIDYNTFEGIIPKRRVRRAAP